MKTEEEEAKRQQMQRLEDAPRSLGVPGAPGAGRGKERNLP